MLRVALASLLSFSLCSTAVIAQETNISGSTSVARVMDVLAEEYNKTHPDNYIAVQGIGSTAGITLLQKGVADLGMTSRYLTENEQDETMKVLPIAFDGLAVITNRSNSVENLSREQLFNIYKGNVTNWKQVGGADQAIAVVTREASSGSRYSFESLLGLTRIVNDRLVSDINPNNLVVNSNSMVKTIVNHNPHAIGFISVGSIDRSVKAISFEGVKPNSKNIGNRSYELSRPFMILYRQGKTSEQALNFVQFVQSKQGQDLVEEYGYTRIK